MIKVKWIIQKKKNYDYKETITDDTEEQKTVIMMTFKNGKIESP